MREKVKRLVGDLLVCFEGLACSQTADLDFFNYTDPDGCLKIEMQFEVNITYEQEVSSV